MEHDDNAVAWETWPDDGPPKRSRIHWTPNRNDRRTACGALIPDRPGVVVGHGTDYGDGECARCRKVWEREDRRECQI